MSTLQKHMGGIMSIFTKNGQGDYVLEGFCPTLVRAHSTIYMDYLYHTIPWRGNRDFRVKSKI